MKDDFQEMLDQLKAVPSETKWWDRLLAWLKAKLGLYPECPSETKWLDLAARLLPESEEAKLVEHSTRCDACAVLQRQATEDFAEIQTLPSAQAERQQALAQKLSAQRPARPEPARDWATPPARTPRRSFSFAWAYAVAAVALIAAGAWLIQKQREPSLDQLIASAYTEQRPFELRVAGAAYGPVRQERSGERSSLAQPAALFRAKYLIKEKLAARPDDASLLAASGKVELLEGNYEAAIRTFGRLADAQPDSPALLTDLATAYFQRAEAGDRAIDYGQTIELLGRVLAKNPNDPVALFNRAIALEKMYAYGEAIRDWEHYLRVDPSGDWATEAQRRLNELREKIEEREKPQAMLRTDPATAAPLLRARAIGQSTTPAPWPVSLDEEYLVLVVREWLPSLYVSVDSQGQQSWRRSSAAWDTLTITAEVLRTHHRDRWLADLLQEIPAESAPPNAVGQFVTALDSLARAAKANASGDPDAARPLAESAARSFGAVRSTAGLLRAREELIYSLVRRSRAQDCIAAATQQLRERNLDSYTWLKVQAILWHATCQSFAGNLDLAQRLSDQALELTQSNGYAGQHLRSVLFASGFLRSTERNWQDTRAGLQKFWAELHHPFHAYESYVEFAIYAEDAEKWHLARLLRRQALGMIERTPDQLFRAAAHYYLAVAAMRVRDLTEAESEFRIASQQFAALPDSPTVRLFKAGSEIRLAAVEFQQERFDSTEAHLQRARPHLADISSTWTAFTHHHTLGQLHLRRGNLLEAEKALWNALRVSEPRLSSLQSDADRLAWERDAGGAYRTLVEMYARKPDTSTRALEVWEWYRASALRGAMPSALLKVHGSGNSDAGPGTPFLSQVRETLPTLKHETVISFARLPSGIAAWAFDNRGVNFAWISASEDDLTRRVKHFVYLCADPSSDSTKLRQEGRDLYDLLLAPFERHLEPSRLLIVEPDSILSEVPWPALVDPRGEYVGSKFAIVVSPGLGYRLNLRRPEAVSPEQKALVVGTPALAAAITSRFSPLPDADREARTIAARFRHARLLLGMAVTSPTIRQELKRSTVFHFAGHAVSSAKQSGLVLASSLAEPDGTADEPTLFSASEMEEASLQQLQLVVLSACATAETEKGFTEPDTLVRGFLRAGVPHVVASRWPVDSHTTAETMAELYSRLFEGLPAAYALQQTTNRLRLRPATSHPYYWAAFGSYGR